MIGNDIVDLRQAALESNWRRKGYMEKLFSVTEQEWIQKAEDPTQMVWLLWTMKEAVYKIHSRRKNWQAFAPLKLICNTLTPEKEWATGIVQCENITFFTQSFLSTHFIHTIASEQFPMQAIRVKINRYDPANVSYRKTAPATVSHHGRYLALAYL